MSRVPERPERDDDQIFIDQFFGRLLLDNNLKGDLVVEVLQLVELIEDAEELSNLDNQEIKELISNAALIINNRREFSDMRREFLERYKK